MAAPLTTTSYAILGLLAIKPWTTYELAQQMQRALGQFWPRAESKLYEEPKKLVAHGLARASSEMVGKRPRTVYSITPKGRRALEAWVPTPGAGPVLEFEQLIKVFFAEHGTKADLLDTIAGTRAWSDQRFAESDRHPAGLPRRERARSPNASLGSSSPGSSSTDFLVDGRAVGRLGHRRRRGLAGRPGGGRAGLATLARMAGGDRGARRQAIAGHVEA